MKTVQSEAHGIQAVVRESGEEARKFLLDLIRREPSSVGNARGVGRRYAEP